MPFWLLQVYNRSTFKPDEVQRVNSHFIVELGINNVRLLYSFVHTLLNNCPLLHDWLVHVAFPLFFFLLGTRNFCVPNKSLSDVTNTAAILGGSMDDRW